MDESLNLRLRIIILKITESSNLNIEDVKSLAIAQGEMRSVEVLNLINHIYHLLGKSTNPYFLINFQKIYNHTTDVRILKVIIQSFQVRMQKEWIKLDQMCREGLKWYVIIQIRKKIQEGGDEIVLMGFNKILVHILPNEWNPLFREFMQAAEADLSLKTLVNNLTILGELFKQDFTTMQKQVTP